MSDAFGLTLERLGEHRFIALPFARADLLRDWATVRSAMIRNRPASFRRDEWAYLLAYLDPATLSSLWDSLAGGDGAALFRPRDPVAVWLPNNVSLLGPLTLVGLSLAGAQCHLKGASSGTDLAGDFLAFLKDHAPEGGALHAWASRRVEYARFDRTDARSARYAASAALRVVFGGDASALAINTLPHPAESVQISFTDKRSVAWVSPGPPDAGTVDALVRVFAIYGQAGCTSPSGVVVLDGDADDARAWCEALAGRYSQIFTEAPEAHLASANTLALQSAAALGWTPQIAGARAAVIAHGPPDAEPFGGPMSLGVTSMSAAEAVLSLPAKIQTIGHALPSDTQTRLLPMLACTSVKRFVPLARMHHFAFHWDGMEWGRALFERMEL
jgi:hypothetical protein